MNLFHICVALVLRTQFIVFSAILVKAPGIYQGIISSLVLLGNIDTNAQNFYSEILHVRSYLL